MTIALWCLFIAGLLHFISKTPLSIAQAKSKGGYDNNNPRDQQAALTGWGKRALAIHQNQIESFPLFAAGVMVATVTGLESPAIGFLSVMYVVARFFYMFCYLKDLATLRSLVWIAGFASSLALMCSPAWA